MFSAFHMFSFSYISPGNHCEHLTWGRKNAGIYASRAFVCLSCMHYFLSFSLPLGVKC